MKFLHQTVDSRFFVAKAKVTFAKKTNKHNSIRLFFLNMEKQNKKSEVPQTVDSGFFIAMAKVTFAKQQTSINLFDCFS